MEVRDEAQAVRGCIACHATGRERGPTPRTCRECEGLGRYVVPEDERLAPGEGAGQIVAVRMTRTGREGEVRYIGREVWIDGVLLDPIPSMRVAWHSDGFEWGYGGSGPMQLALAICLARGVPKGEAEQIAGDVKERFIAGADRNHMVLSVSSVDAFIAGRRAGMHTERARWEADARAASAQASREGRPGGHPEIDARVRALTEIAAERIDADPTLVRVGLEAIERWTAAKGGYVPACHAEWRHMIETMTWPEIRERLLAHSDEGQRLRSTHPFSELVTDAEREAIRAAHRA